MPHALIIEDEFLIAITIEEALTALGYSTFDCVAGEAQAIEAARARCPDLIVADHRLTDGTGTAAVQAICFDKAIPVVFITGSAEEVRASLPCAIIVSKPFAPPLLADAILLAVAQPLSPSIDDNGPAGEVPLRRT